MIPKVLHIVWIGGHLPPTAMINSWADKHINGWIFVLWKEHKANWENQAVIDHFVQNRCFNGAADCMRYEILAKHGGIAVDADSTCVKALDEGPEEFLNNETAIACYENEAVRPGMIGCGFLGAPKGHKFFKACVEDVPKQDSKEAAWKSVGPMLMVRMAEKLPHDIRVYPARHFNPEHYSGALAPGQHAIYAKQGWGSTKGYNQLRPLACTCPECSITMLRPPWG